MSVVSESHGGADAPELLPEVVISLRHRCQLCGRSLIGRRMVATRDGDLCEPCHRAPDSGIGYSARLRALGLNEPE